MLKVYFFFWWIVQLAFVVGQIIFFYNCWKLVLSRAQIAPTKKLSNKSIILINVFLSSDLTSCSTGFWRWTTATTKLGTKAESVGTSDTRGQPPELTGLPKRLNSKTSLKRRNSKTSQKRRKPKTSENWLRRWSWWQIKGRRLTSMSTNTTTMKKWLEWFCFPLLFLS